MEKKLTIKIIDENGLIIGDMEITDFSDVDSRIYEAIELVKETLNWYVNPNRKV